MKLDRLLSMTTLLLNQGSATAPELAQRFGVSVRTIYRDVDTLSEAGIPVYTSQGAGGGISLVEDYTLGKLPVSDNERDSMILALQALAAARYPDADTALQKVSALFHNDQTSWIHVQFSSYGIHPPEMEKFSILRTCILEHRLLSFDYINGKAESSHRVVEPGKLWLWGNAWFLWAFCRARNACRTFRVSRIRAARAENEHFTPRNTPSFEQYTAALTQDTRPHVRLKLWVAPRGHSRAYDTFPSESITAQADGSLLIELRFPDDEWTYATLLSFGCDLRVLEPEAVRREIIRRMQAALDQYRT